MKKLGEGMISRVNKFHMWIRLNEGGEVVGPRLKGFTRGDKVQFLTNGPNTQIIAVYHEKKIHVPALHLLHSIIQEAQEDESSWFESWVPLCETGSIV